MRVTDQNYPLLHAAFVSICLDNNMQDLFTADNTFQVPDMYASSVGMTEQFLATLNEEQRETFCNGEQSEVAELRKTHPWGAYANELLNKFFDEWEED